MATILPTSLSSSGQITLVETTLNNTNDTFTYRPNTGQILVMRNATAGALSPVIDGADGTTVDTRQLGRVSVAAGFAVGSIPAGQARVIRLDTISAFLQGPIAITGGTGLVCSLLS
jgi:undecaprenyl pyrophosphate phosphatase UppP